MDRQDMLSGFGRTRGIVRDGISTCLLSLAAILFCCSTVIAQGVCEDKTEPGNMTLSRVTIQASALESSERTGGDILHRSLGLVGLEQGGNAQSDVMFQEQGAYIQTTPSQKSNGIVVPLIPKEQTGGVADRVYFHYENPDVTMRSYAAVTLEDTNGSSYCSGTMIGPNVMMTAAH